MNRRIDEAVAARAYKLWEKAGKPEGRDEEFWHLAEQELLNEDKESRGGRPTLCKANLSWPPLRAIAASSPALRSWFDFDQCPPAVLVQHGLKVGRHS
jgi:hypothetical protein